MFTVIDLKRFGFVYMAKSEPWLVPVLTDTTKFALEEAKSLLLVRYSI